MMNTTTPGSFEDLKAFVLQFEAFLPEPTRNAIQKTLQQIEASGGIQNEAQGAQLLKELVESLTP